MNQQRRNIPDLRVLKTFECAARQGNFTRAGEELHLTQSAVSRQINELEQQLGKQLFTRVRGRVVLTQFGSTFQSEVTQLLQMAESTMRHATAGAGADRVLSINALPTFAGRWLLPRLPDFLSKNPDVRVDISTRREIFEFSSVQCDIAIHYGQPIWPGASCTYLCSEIMVPVAGGVLRDLHITNVLDLANAPKVHLTERPHLWPDWLASHDVRIEDANRGHWFDQFSLIIEAVVGGLGYALLPMYLIEKELRSGELKIVIDSPYSTDSSYYIVVPNGREAKVAALSEWIFNQVH